MKKVVGLEQGEVRAHIEQFLLSDVLRNFSLKDISLFVLYILLLFAGKASILWFIDKVYRTHSARHVIPTIKSLLNWLAFYGTIVFFLFYFSKEKWLFATIYEVKGLKVSLFVILVAFIILTFANRMAKEWNRHIMPLIYNRFHVDIGTGYSINRLIYYTVMITAFVISFAIVGFNWKSIAIIFSTLGIGIGFGLRNVAANFVSGLIILFEKPLEVGEVIEVEGQAGIVTKIKLRSTSLKLYKEGNLIIPNQYLLENIILNRKDDKLLTNVTLSVAYGTDTQQVDSLIWKAVEQAISEVKGTLEDPPPAVRFDGIRQSALEFIVEIPVLDAEAKETLEDRLRHLIISSFYEHNIQLANMPFDIVAGKRDE